MVEERDDLEVLLENNFGVIPPIGESQPDILDQLLAAQTPEEFSNAMGAMPTTSQNKVEGLGEFIGLFGKGLANTIDLPSIAMSAVTGQKGFRFGDMFAVEREGFLANYAELLGSSTVPFLGGLKWGKSILQNVPRESQNFFQKMLSGAANRPLRAAEFEGLAITGAAGGETLAEKAGLDEVGQALTSLAAGLVTPVAVPLTRVAAVSQGLYKSVAETMQRNLAPIFKPKKFAQQRAVTAIQSRHADPQAAAVKIDVDSPFSAARQTGEERAVALEDGLLRSRPDLEAQLDERARQGLAAMRREIEGVRGEAQGVRNVVRRQSDYLINLMQKRAGIAAEEARIAAASLDIPAPLHQRSRMAFEKLEQARVEAHSVQAQLWNDVGGAAEHIPQNARTALETQLAQISKILPKESKIPGWIKKALKKKNLSFNDIKQMRTRIEDMIDNMRTAGKDRTLKSGLQEIAGYYDEAGNISGGLLQDMMDAATSGEALQAARKFSRDYHKLYTHGPVGKLLGFDKGAIRSTQPDEMLEAVFAGRATRKTVEDLLTAAPDTKPMLEDFLRMQFQTQVLGSGKTNQKAMRKFMDHWDNKGIFQALPDLRGELEDATRTVTKAGLTATRAEIVATRGGSRFIHHSRKSLAALYLDARPGEEIARIMTMARPVSAAAQLRRRLTGDADAIAGLKTAYLEYVYKQSARRQPDALGNVMYDGLMLRKNLKETSHIAKRLGFSEDDIRRGDLLAERLIQYQNKPGRTAGTILSDPTGEILDLAFAYMGAQAGQTIASGGIGSSLVLAGRVSKRFRSWLHNRLDGPALDLIIAAHMDNQMYKSMLMKTGTVTLPRQETQRQWGIIEAWMFGVATKAMAANNTQNSIDYSQRGRPDDR